MKKKLTDLLLKKEARKTELGAKATATEDIKELRAINTELETLNTEIAELRNMIDAVPDEEPEPKVKQKAKAKRSQPDEKEADDETGDGDEEFRSEKLNGKAEQRDALPKGVLNPIGTYAMDTDLSESRAKELKEASEKRGKDLREKRSVTVGSSNILVPTYQATDLRPTFNEVSSLIDRVTRKPLIGGESFRQPYVTGYGTGDYTAEEADYASAEATFGYASINRAKVTAYAEDTEELQKLPAADYDAEVMKGISIAARKKISREILVGTGATNHIAGIFTAAATAIDAGTDIAFDEIDEDTLDEIIFSFGGDEEVEDAAVLVLNKKDLKAFALLKDSNGKKIYDIKTSGNTGTINTIPFIINSTCKAVSDPSTNIGDYAMAYGPLSNYMLCIFSDMEVQRSTDYKFKQGMIAHKGAIFAGGNVVSKNGFLRVKKG